MAQYMVLTAVNQLWVADITYIRLASEFVYFATVLDAFSRRVLGWSLSRSLKAPLPLAALNRAIAARQPAPGLVHHSDRGSQYASDDYVGRLEECRITPSMSRPARPWENAKCERRAMHLTQVTTIPCGHRSLKPGRAIPSCGPHLPQLGVRPGRSPGNACVGKEAPWRASLRQGEPSWPHVGAGFDDATHKMLGSPESSA